MKKIGIIIFCLPLLTYAQPFIPQALGDEYYLNFVGGSYIDLIFYYKNGNNDFNRGLKSIKEYREFNENKGDILEAKEKYYFRKFDENGRLIETNNSYTSRLDFFHGRKIFLYYDDTQVSMFTWYDKKNRLIERELYTFDENGFPKELFYYKKDSINPSQIRTIDRRIENTGSTIEISRRKYLNNKNYMRIVFTFDTLKNKKRTIWYKKNGKIDHVYDYSCDNIGKEILKDTLLVCEKVEMNEDGTYTHSFRWKKDSRGKILEKLEQYTYDADSNLIAYYFYDWKNNLQEKSVFEYDRKNLMRESHWTKNKLRHERINLYDNSNRMTESRLRTRRHMYITEYKYDDSGNNIEYIIYNDVNKKLEKRVTKDYDVRGNLIATRYYDSKNKYQKTSFTEYEYY